MALQQIVSGTNWAAIRAAINGNATEAESRMAAIESESRVYLSPGTVTDHGDIDQAGSVRRALDNYETVVLLPGVYPCGNQSKIPVNSGQKLIGSGHNTILQKNGAWDEFIRLNGGAQLADCRVDFQRSGSYSVGIGAIHCSSELLNVITNVLVNATGLGANGICLSGSTAWLNSVIIVTEGVGISVQYSGQWYFDCCDIALVGSNVGADHIGIYLNQGGRVHWFGGKIGTGYGYPEITGDTDRMFCGIYAAPSVTDGRFSFWNLNSFIRIDDGASDPALASVYRDDSGNGWTRFFGCFGQSEIPTGAAAWQSKAIVNDQGGKVETYGCRLTGYDGPVMGSPQVGVRTITAASTTLTKFEGGWILLDASSNAVTVALPSGVGPAAGEQLFFKCVDATNTVTLSTSGGSTTIDGSTANRTMSAGEVIKMFYDGSGWQTE